MRLTLRTLLAYLDDTLEPAEIKLIGQKLAESDTAQELVDRIKQVVRRRRLTAPPAHGTGAKLDANTVAEYLENELSSDELGELEKVCLEGDPDADMYLAEVAACHQILTLVLGEPGMVPPTAKERMYELAHGKEAIRSRKAAVPNRNKMEEPMHLDDEDSPLLDFSAGSGRPWMRWAIPLIALGLLIGIGAALWFALPDNNAPPAKPNDQVAQNEKPSGEKPAGEQPSREKPSTASPSTEKPSGEKPVGEKPTGETPSTEKPVGERPVGEKPPGEKPVGEKPPGEKPVGEKPPGERPSGEKPTPPVVPPVEPPKKPGPPSDVVAAAGTYIIEPMQQSNLAQNKGGAWTRVAPNNAVSTATPLVSLPGYSSTIRTNSGVQLLMRGNVSEFSVNPVMDFLLDSAVVLHKSTEFDLDLTLQRGRIYLSNRKAQGSAKVRLRFQDEVWDLTLSTPGTEIGVDLLSLYTKNINYLNNEAPYIEVHVCLLNGDAGLRIIDTFTSYPSLSPPPNGAVLVLWNNKQSQPVKPIKIRDYPPHWRKEIPMKAEAGPRQAVEQMKSAMVSLNKLMVGPKQVGVVLREIIQDQEKSLPTRLLAIQSLAAIDDVAQLVEVLDTNGPAAEPERNVAVHALRRWISRDAANGNKLFDVEKSTGVLRDKSYSINSARIFLALLHDLSEGKGDPPDLSAHFAVLLRYMKDESVAIRHLANWVLLRASVPVVKTPPEFNAGWPPEQRAAAVEAWEKALAAGNP